MKARFKWDTNKHDQQITERKQREQKLSEQQATQRGHEIIAREYAKLKRAFVQQFKRDPDKATPQECVAFLHRLYGMVETACKHTPGMEDFRKKALAMIERNVELTVATAAGMKNAISEILPTTIANDPNRLTLPEVWVFESQEALEACPLVQRFAVKEGYVGLVRDGKLLKALFEDGEAVPVGTLACLTGMERVVTEQAMRQELQKKKDGQ